MRKEIKYIAGALHQARRMHHHLPDRKKLTAYFSGQFKKLQGHWIPDKGKLLILRPRSYYAVFESPDAMALSDGRWILTLRRSSKKCVISLKLKNLQWTGEYKASGRELFRIPEAEEFIIRKNRISRSRRRGEYMLAVTDMFGYGYRYNGNGILSFNKLTTPSLFTKMNWLKRRGRELLQAAAADIPGNIVSRILSARIKKEGHLGERGSLTAFALNFFRRRAGLPQVLPSRPLTRAAAGHAGYIAANIRSGRRRPPHRQYRDGYGFTGKRVTDRVRTAGFTGSAVELIGYEGNPVSCIAEWMHTVHHRGFLLDSRAVRCGFGTAPFAYSDSSGTGVLLLGRLATKTAAIRSRWTGFFPIWPIWDGREEPSSVEPALGPFGPPLHFGSGAVPYRIYEGGRRIRTRTFRLSGATCQVPARPLPWNSTILLENGKKRLRIRTLPYPPSLRILDQLHRGCKKK